MRVVIVDDEPLARAYLKRLLAPYDAEVVGEGKTGIDALNLTEQLHPDVVFLDIEMPDLTGMQAAAALADISNPPRVVFVTGFSEHAPAAFEHAAFDYLLKPVTPERIALTVSRIRKSLTAPPAIPDESQMEGLTPLARLPVRTDYAVKLLRVEEILCAVAREKRVFVKTEASEQKTYYTLNQLEKLLPAVDFMRVHASVIVRLSAVDELNFLGNHSYSLKITGGLALPVSRSQFPELQRRLGALA